MTRQTRTIDLESEAQRLDDRLDDLASEASAVDSDSDEYSELQAEAARVERQLVGVKWALNPDSADREPVGEVTVGEVLTGDFAKVEDRAQDVKRQRVGRGDDSSVSGAQRVFFVAAGLVDAPFLDGSDAGFEARARAVRDLKPQFTAWLEDQIDDLSTPDVDVGNFEDRVERTS